VKVKLYRDEARAIQIFFNYWYLLCDSKANHPDNAGVETQQMMWMLLASVLCQVEKKFNKRLSGFANRFFFSFTTSEAITLYTFLLSHPISSEQVWLSQLRQTTVDILHKQVFS